MADSENFDLSQYIAKLLETIVDRLDTKVMSQTLADHLRQMTTTQGLKERQVLDTKQIDKIFKEFIRDWRDSTGSVSNSMQGAVTSLREKLKEMSSKGTDVTLKSALDNLSNLISTLVHVSSQQIEAGKKPFINVNDPKAQSSILLTGVMKDTYKALGGKLDALNDSFDKVLGFFQKGEQTERTKQRRFIDDLVDGLGKNKFIGGVLHDVVMFFGLMIASKLKEFGTLGKIIGGVLFGAIQVLATMLPGIITRAVFDGVGRALRGVFRGTFDIFRNIGRFFTRGRQTSVGGRALLSATTSTGMTVSGKAVTDAELAAAKSVGTGAKAGASIAGTGAKLAGRQLLSKAAFGLGALWDVGDAIGSWKEGKKGAATAFGAAAAVGGVSLAAAGPTMGASLVVGGVIAAILSLLGVFLRDFRGDKKEASDYRKKMASDVGDIKKETLGDKISNWWNRLTGGSGQPGAGAGVFQPGGGGGNGLPPQAFGSNVQMLSGKTTHGHLDPSKMTEADWQQADTLQPVYGKHGEILNLGMMSQKRASEVIAADIAAKGNNSYYEFIGKEYADVGSFETDAKALDNSGVYGVRGTKDSFLKTLKGLQAQGINTRGAKITSTIGTLGRRGHMSPHTYRSGAGGHFSTDIVYDIGGAGIGKLSQKTMEAANRDFYWVNPEIDHSHVAQKGPTAAQVSIGVSTMSDKIKQSTVEGRKQEMAQQHSLEDKPQPTQTDHPEVFKKGQTKSDKTAYVSPTGNKEFLEAQPIMGRLVLWGTDLC